MTEKIIVKSVVLVMVSNCIPAINEYIILADWEITYNIGPILYINNIKTNALKFIISVNQQAI